MPCLSHTHHVRTEIVSPDLSESKRLVPCRAFGVGKLFALVITEPEKRNETLKVLSEARDVVDFYRHAPCVVYSPKLACGGRGEAVRSPLFRGKAPPFTLPPSVNSSRRVAKSATPLLPRGALHTCVRRSPCRSRYRPQSRRQPSAPAPADHSNIN